jgi:glutamate 5-kinase
VRRPVAPGSNVVVKVGSSSLTESGGGLDDAAVGGVVDQVAALVASGHPTVLVTSAAIAAGFPALGLDHRPTVIADLQVAAAVGQSKLMARYSSLFGAHGIEVGQVLLTKDVLGTRGQYLNARSAIGRMLELGVVPIVNENDTVAVDEVRFGDNDRLAAIASHLVGAGMLVLLTDTDGLFTDDPRLTEKAELLTAVAHSDEILDRIRESKGTGAFGSGGVATKVVAARMAAFSGVPTVIGSGSVPNIVRRAVAGEDVGTWIDPRETSLPARKLWIAFGLPSAGSITIDDGAVRALTEAGKSLLAAGVTGVNGPFKRGDAIEVITSDGRLCAKGVARVSSNGISEQLGQHSSAIGGEVIHRDDLVLLV